MDEKQDGSGPTQGTGQDTGREESHGNVQLDEGGGLSTVGTRANLQARRIASYCLNAVCKNHTLGTKVRTFIGDQIDDWEVKSDWEIFALVDGERVAEIYLTGDTNATIIIPNWFALIRREHLGDFDPKDHGIEIDDRYDPVTLDPYVDGDYLMTYSTEQIPGYDRPQTNLPRTVGGRRFKVIASI